jgi:hypothetical protein
VGAGADRSRERERRRWAPVPDFRSEGARASDSGRWGKARRFDCFFFVKKKLKTK